jgi:peptide subunit release factor 1 (eRF1)
MLAPEVPAESVESIDDHLERLLAFEPTSLPVISVYLNTQSDQHGRTPDVAGYLQREFKALARTWETGSPERTSFDEDTAKILAYVEEKLAPEANGVTFFACSGADNFFEAIQLQAPLEENRVYVYHQPHLFHLTRLDDEYPRYAAVVTDANTARIFLFGLGQTVETEQVKGKKVQRVKVGGWSQARYQRRVENAHQQHAKELAERLERLVREENVAHIVLAGDPAMTSLLQEELPKAIAELVVDTLKLDAKTSEENVFAATLEKMREADSRSDAEKVQRLFEQYRARGLACIGTEATLEALANGQVDELLISVAMEQERPAQEPVEAILAPEIPDQHGGTESEEPREASMADLLVTKAKQTDARISFIEDAVLLANVEGVGAFLRWLA